MPYKDKDKEREYNRLRMQRYRNTLKGKASIAQYREKTKKERSDWAREYYKKNRERILARTSEYNKTHPQVRKKAQDKSIAIGKSTRKGKVDRERLKPHYLVAQIKKEGSTKSIKHKEVEIIIYRIKKSLSKINKSVNEKQD